MSDPHGDVIAIETPEHVVFEYELAGFGTRIFAALLDVLFIVLGLVAILVVLLIISATGGDLGNWGAAVAIVSAFVLLWGYPIFFEILWRGQTPGKRLLRMRVIREGGYALTPPVVIVRNLLRVADFLPAMYFLGLAVMVLNRRYKRIGDWVAGTLVIRDRPRTSAPARLETRALNPARHEERVADLRRVGVHRLAPEQIHLIEDFMKRRYELSPEARVRLVRELSRTIATTLGIAAQEDFGFLQSVLLAYREGEKRAAGNE